MNAMSGLIGMLRSPRRTLADAIQQPRSLQLAFMIVLISAACSVGFLMTRVGRLAALDQQVRQLESLGVLVTDQVYSDVRAWERYRPLISAAPILIGWPLIWAVAAGVVSAIGKVPLKPDTAPPGLRAPFAQGVSEAVSGSPVLSLSSPSR